MPDIEIFQLFANNGPVDQLQLDEEFQVHLLEAGRAFAKHVVSFAELTEVHAGEPRYFKNEQGQRAPAVMVGPTKAGRFLFVPIEPTGAWGVWRAVTAFTANTHSVERYQQELQNESQ